jgi:hypothetical protein
MRKSLRIQIPHRTEPKFIEVFIIRIELTKFHIFFSNTVEFGNYGWNVNNSSVCLFFGLICFLLSKILCYNQKFLDIYKSFSKFRASIKRKPSLLHKVSKFEFTISNLKIFHLNIQKLRPKSYPLKQYSMSSKIA